MTHRRRPVAAGAAIALLLSGCTGTQDPTPATTRPPTGAASDSVLVIGLGDAWPEHVDIPNPVFADDPAAAPYSPDDPLPSPALDGLSIYPVWALESENVENITFIDANGLSVSKKTYQNLEVCVGPDGKANAVLALEGVTLAGEVPGNGTVSTDVLDPSTGETLWSTPTFLSCVIGSDYVAMFEYAEGKYSGRGGIARLSDRKTVIDLMDNWNFAAIDSHTFDVATEDKGIVLDLDSQQSVEHQGLVPRHPKWLKLPKDYSRDATLPSVTAEADGVYFTWDSDWVSDPLGGLPMWYNENVAVIGGAENESASLVDRSGGVLAGPFASIAPIGTNLLLVCARQVSEECAAAGVLKADGNWLVPRPDDETTQQVVGYTVNVDLAPARLAVFASDGSMNLVDLESGSSTPLPNAGKVMYTAESPAECVGFTPQADDASLASQSPGGFVRPDANLVALPDGYHVSRAAVDPLLLDRRCETVTTTNFMPDEIKGQYPPTLTFTEDGHMLPPGVNVTHTFGPGLTWVTWGDYWGYLTTDGHWLWRGGGPGGE